MKTTITSTGFHRVAIKFVDAFTGDIVETEYSAPVNGGYVRNANNTQVCKNLSTRGDTLQWGGVTPLIDLIRREYNAMRRSEKALGL